MDQTPQNIEERLNQLPADVRTAVLSVEWEAKVQAIGARHKLHIDQLGALGDTTLMAMLGFFDLAEYPSRLVQDLKLAPDEAAAVAKEVSDEVFMPIRESLKHIAAKAPAPAAPAPVPVAPQAPKPPKPDLKAADAMLSTTAVSIAAPKPASPAAAVPPAQPEPPKPAAYAADPYREPPM